MDTRNMLTLFQDLISLLFCLLSVYDKKSLNLLLFLQNCVKYFIFLSSWATVIFSLSISWCYWFLAPILISFLPTPISMSTLWYTSISNNTPHSKVISLPMLTPNHDRNSRLNWVTSMFSWIQAYFYFLLPFQNH